VRHDLKHLQQQSFRQARPVRVWRSLSLAETLGHTRTRVRGVAARQATRQRTEGAARGSATRGAASALGGAACGARKKRSLAVRVYAWAPTHRRAAAWCARARPRTGRSRRCRRARRQPSAGARPRRRSWRALGRFAAPTTQKLSLSERRRRRPAKQRTLQALQAVCAQLHARRWLTQRRRRRDDRRQAKSDFRLGASPYRVRPDLLIVVRRR
jgi:hypothetical protein